MGMEQLGYNPKLGEHHAYDPQLQHDRHQNKKNLKRRFEYIFAKYERDFDGIGDEIDLETGEIVIDNGHVRNMRHEADTGARAFVVDTPMHSQDQESYPAGVDEDSDDEGMQYSTKMVIRTVLTDTVTDPAADASVSSEEAFDSSVAPAELDELALDPCFGNATGTTRHTPARTWNTAAPSDRTSQGIAIAADVLNDVPGLKESLLAFQIKSMRNEPTDSDAIQALGVDIATQLSALMSRSDDPIVNRGRRSSTLRHIWSYPELPGSAAKLPKRKPKPRISLPSTSRLSPAPVSLWAPASHTRRRHKQILSPWQDQTTNDDLLSDASTQGRVGDGPLTELSDLKTNERNGVCADCGHISQSTRCHGDKEEHSCNFCSDRLSSDTVPKLTERRTDCDGDTTLEASEIMIQVSVESSMAHNEKAKLIRFTPEEDARIIKLKEIDQLRWEDLAIHFDGRTTYALQCRYSRRLHNCPSKGRDALISQGHTFQQNADGSYLVPWAKGPFTSVEDIKILTLRDEQGLDWQNIAISVPGRAPGSIERRYHEILDSNQNLDSTDPLLSKQKRKTKKHEHAQSRRSQQYTAEEDERLRMLRKERNLAWTDIAPFFDGRSPGSLQKHFTRDLEPGWKRYRRPAPADDDSPLLDPRLRQIDSQAETAQETKVLYVGDRDIVTPSPSLNTARSRQRVGRQSDGLAESNFSPATGPETSLLSISHTSANVHQHERPTPVGIGERRYESCLQFDDNVLGCSDGQMPSYMSSQYLSKSRKSHNTESKHASSASFGPVARAAPNPHTWREVGGRAPRWTPEERERVRQLHAQGMTFEQMEEYFTGRSSSSLAICYSVHFGGNGRKTRDVAAPQAAQTPLLRQALDNSHRRHSEGISQATAALKSTKSRHSTSNCTDRGELVTSEPNAEADVRHLRSTKSASDRSRPVLPNAVGPGGPLSSEQSDAHALRNLPPRTSRKPTRNVDNAGSNAEPSSTAHTPPNPDKNTLNSYTDDWERDAGSSIRTRTTSARQRQRQHGNPRIGPSFAQATLSTSERGLERNIASSWDQPKSRIEPISPPQTLEIGRSELNPSASKEITSGCSETGRQTRTIVGKDRGPQTDDTISQGQPTVSYRELVMMALRSNDPKPMTSKEVLKSIESKFPYYKDCSDRSWRTAVYDSLRTGPAIERVPQLWPQLWRLAETRIVTQDCSSSPLSRKVDNNSVDADESGERPKRRPGRPPKKRNCDDTTSDLAPPSKRTKRCGQAHQKQKQSDDDASPTSNGLEPAHAPALRSMKRSAPSSEVDEGEEADSNRSPKRSKRSHITKSDGVETRASLRKATDTESIIRRESGNSSSSNDTIALHMQLRSHNQHPACDNSEKIQQAPSAPSGIANPKPSTASKQNTSTLKPRSSAPTARSVASQSRDQVTRMRTRSIATAASKTEGPTQQTENVGNPNRALIQVATASARTHGASNSQQKSLKEATQKELGDECIDASKNAAHEDMARTTETPKLADREKKTNRTPVMSNSETKKTRYSWMAKGALHSAARSARERDATHRAMTDFRVANVNDDAGTPMVRVDDFSEDELAL